MEGLLGPFEELNEKAVLRLEQAKDDNRLIAGVFCAFAPEEIIRAADAIPVSLCGKSEIPISDAEEVLPSSLCPLIKSSYGYAYTDTCPYFGAADFIIGETTCDGKKKMFEYLNELIPTHVMQLPYLLNDDSAFLMWKNEVEKLKGLLEKKTGRKIDDSRISKEVTLLNRRRSLLNMISELMKKKTPPLTGKEHLLIMESRNFAYDIDEYNGLLEALYKKIEDYENPELENRKRVLITGCPMGIGTDRILEITEELGGAVVAQENCTGLKGFDRLCPEGTDIMDTLAGFYLNTPCACMSPNENRYKKIAELTDDFSVDAVIDATLFNCQPYNVESRKIGELCESRSQVPFLHLETDYSGSDTEQLKTRIEAFLEML